MKKLSLEDFLFRAKEIHGDKYDYSLVEYVNTSTKVNIICPKHGPFPQTPESHYAGRGCRKCGRDLLRKDKEFIERANKVHNNKYDYSQVNYVVASQNVTIICPVHGPFEQTPASHITNKSGCYSCARVKSVEQILQEIHTAHGNLYKYNINSPIKGEEQIEIICSIHGPFTQRLSSHIEGYGCPHCAAEERRLTSPEFIRRSWLQHSGKFDYSKTVYTTSSTSVEIICPVHGPFSTNPSNHMRGSDCPNCAKYGFKPNQPAILYYLSINDGEAYKIGITNRTVSERFESDMQYITILHQVHYKNGQDAYNEEQRILKQFKEFKYIGPDLLKSGNTELFNVDILNIKDQHD